MKKTALLLITVAALLLPLAAAQQAEKVIYATIKWNNGSFEISNLSVTIDYRTEINQNGNYLVKLIGKNGKTLYQLKIAKFISRVPAPADANFEEKQKWYADKYKYGEMAVFLPYLKEAKTLSFEHGTSILARANLSKLCNEDGKCNNNENYLSCPEDCKLNKKDNYCLAQKDGTCDPDCAQGIDPDCKTTTKPKIANSTRGFIIVGAIIATIILIIWSKKRKNKNNLINK